MNKLFWLELQLSFHMQANELIYYLQHVPLIRRLVKDRWYWNFDGKQIWGVLGFVISMIKGMIFSTLLICAILGLPVLLLMNEANQFPGDRTGTLIFLTFLLYCLFGAWSNNVIISRSYDADEYMYLHVMHVDAKAHFMMMIINRLAMTFVEFIMLMFFIGFGNYLKTVFLVICYRGISEAVQLFLYERRSFKKSDHSLVNGLAMAAILALAYLTVFMTQGELTWAREILHPIHLILAAVLGLLSVRYLFQYPSYRRIAAECVLKESLAFESAKEADAVTKGMYTMNAKDEEHMKLETMKDEKATGYAYLTKLFFRRHYSLFSRRIKIKCIISGLALLAYGVTSIFVKQMQTPDFFRSIIMVTPVFLYVFYLISSGKSVCSALFYNCDRVFLKYGYYRKKGAILENFRLRIRYIIAMDLLPSLILTILPWEALVISKSYEDWPIALMISIMFLCVTVFFATYATFAYYVCQPYTEEMKVQSKLYGVLDAVVAIIAYIGYGLRNVFTSIDEFVIFTGIVLMVMLFFIPLSFFLIYRIAPKSFRLK